MCPGRQVDHGRLVTSRDERQSHVIRQTHHRIEQIVIAVHTLTLGTATPSKTEKTKKQKIGLKQLKNRLFLRSESEHDQHRSGADGLL